MHDINKRIDGIEEDVIKIKDQINTFYQQLHQRIEDVEEIFERFVEGLDGFTAAFADIDKPKDDSL
jgi:archaellum component FlaC